METIRVCNLRCLADSTTIEIKPITLLVGANSSGKSSFLRLFPLLKQSHEIRTLGGLVLNEGDVNFGFFNEALHKDADPPELTLEFGFTMQQGLYQGTPWNSFVSNPLEVTCALVYVKRAKDQRYPRVRCVHLSLKGGDEFQDRIEISAEEDGKITSFKVNEFDGTDQVGNVRLLVGRGLAPGLVFVVDLESPSDTTFTNALRMQNPFDKKILSETSSLFHGNTSADTRLAMFHSFPIGSPKQMLEHMRQNGIPSWHDQIRNWDLKSPRFLKVRDLLLAGRVNDILGSVNVYITQLARSVHYFQPVRSSVDRDYLTRDVSITAVDPSGLNVALVLSSLSPSSQQQFREWMRNHFGFEVSTQSVGDGARIALRMRDAASGSEFNLADTGFGFSQMLPFLVQIWNIVEGETLRTRSNRFFRVQRSANSTNYLIAIEQPELHLHPGLQARLADMIVSMANISKERGVPVRFMLETHSPTIIERVGQSVEAQRISSQDVQVILFELGRERPNLNTTIVKTASFDSNGVLQDWPFGFLSAPIAFAEN